MNQAVYPVLNEDAKELVLHRLAALPIPKTGLDIFVRPHKVHRTNAQNDRLQWLCRSHAGWLNRERQRLVAEGKLPSYWPETDTDGVRRMIFNPLYCHTKSSTHPSKLDMMEILTHYEADLRNMGVELPENQPEEPW